MNIISLDQHSLAVRAINPSSKLGHAKAVSFDFHANCTRDSSSRRVVFFCKETDKERYFNLRKVRTHLGATDRTMPRALKSKMNSDDDLKPETNSTVTTWLIFSGILAAGYGAFGTIIYPSFGNILLSSHSILNIVAGISSYASESAGVNAKYSKFSRSKEEASTVSSRTGMLLFYTPSLLLSLSFLIGLALPNIVGSLPPYLSVGHGSQREFVISALLFAHFGKRVLETLFVHKYSGSMAKSAVQSVPVHYFLLTLAMLSLQVIVDPLAPPTVDLMLPGVILSLVGLTGNLYHHLALAKLREASKEYQVPAGGLFDQVACPHYLFEIIGFWGFALASQTIAGFSAALFTSFYLAGRSVATLKWYKSKFEDYPVERKALVPGIF